MPTAVLVNPDRKHPIAFESLAGAKPESQATVNNFRSSKLTPGSMSFVDRLFGASANASRRYSTSNISFTIWLDQPGESKDNKNSLHVDPAHELPDTTKQDDCIPELAPKLRVIQVNDLAVQDTTKDQFSYEFASDEYNMHRNALNSYSDPANRSASQSDLQEKIASETTMSISTSANENAESRCRNGNTQHTTSKSRISNSLLRDHQSSKIRLFPSNAFPTQLRCKCLPT